MISNYSHQQFCLGKGDRPRLALRAHPDIEDGFMLTIYASTEAQFTLSGGREQLLAIVQDIAALFEKPLAPGQEREQAATNVRSEPAYEPDLDTAEDTYER